MIKKATVAGRFYPKESVKLKDNVVSYLREIEPLKNKVYGILVPHAGYVYSGAIAGEGFSHIKEIYFDTIVFFAAAHTMDVDGAALMKEGFFETPLGQVEIDSKITKELLKSLRFLRIFPKLIKVNIPLKCNCLFCKFYQKRSLK